MRAVRIGAFGGSEVLDVHNVVEPHAGPGHVRVRVRAVGLNPMDCALTSNQAVAQAMGVSLPSGFGCDYAGVVDEVGDDVDAVSVGDRVFGAVIARTAADWVVMQPGVDSLLRTPAGVDDEVAATLCVAGSTADAALRVIGVGPGDTVLIGGAAGGVGVFAVQLAVLAGARVIGTASGSTFGFLRGLGAEPVAYGDGMVARVRAIAPQGVSAAVSLVGTDTIGAALELGVAPQRISSIAAGPNPPRGVRATGATEATPGAVDRIAALVAAGRLTVPIAATYPFERIRDALDEQRTGHVHGKVVVRF
ncbi:NADP-dependent oxidoreductase [Mycobacterium sp. WMMD1722]|uniref:NADP-dependent oxidoreductase n=1 Tax=Mycobacterium sp. WMMD1722 TaxID=3404117 RepID=UPI003BF48E23